MICLTVNFPPHTHTSTSKFESTSSCPRQTVCSVLHCGGVFALMGGERESSSNNSFTGLQLGGGKGFGFILL